MFFLTTLQVSSTKAHFIPEAHIGQASPQSLSTKIFVDQSHQKHNDGVSNLYYWLMVFLDLEGRR